MPRRGQANNKRQADGVDADASEQRAVAHHPSVAAATAANDDRATALPTKDEEDWEDMPSTDSDDDDVIDEQVDDGEIVDDDADVTSETEAAPDASKANDDDDDEPAAQVWRRDQSKSDQAASAAADKLSYNNKAYDCFFQLKSEFPCLSFDVLRDADGDSRTKYPLGMYVVCGSQAPNANDNLLYIIKVSNLLKTKHDVGSDEDSEEDDDVLGAAEDSDEDDEDDDAEFVNQGEPIVDYKTVKHYGTVNRLRCDPHHPSMVLTWSESGHVQVFDVVSEMRSMSDFAAWSKEQSAAAVGGKRPRPAVRFVSAAETHKTEGYGLAWSHKQPHVFATGDCAGAMIVWTPTEDGRWLPSVTHPSTHTASVEEIKFSPSQAHVHICGRAGGHIEVWDSRTLDKPKLAWRADPTDINVCDWNQTTTSSHLLVSGADSGVVAVWDLRAVQRSGVQPLQNLTFHQGHKITAVEFSLHNESVLAVTSDDGQCTLWDLSLERDPDEEAEVMGSLFGRKDIVDLPDQLMFQHQGLEHPKEVHFHSQIPGMTITTDFHGLHLFKPMNWRSLMK